MEGYANFQEEILTKLRKYIDEGWYGAPSNIDKDGIMLKSDWKHCLLPKCIHEIR